jgi:hypothetical protein
MSARVPASREKQPRGQTLAGEHCAVQLAEATGAICRWSRYLDASNLPLQCCCEDSLVASKLQSPHTIRKTGQFQMGNPTCLPSLWLVGFPKAGTSAFHTSLLRHPYIAEGAAKELALPLYGLLAPGTTTALKLESAETILNRSKLLQRPSQPHIASRLLLNSDTCVFSHLQLVSQLLPEARIVFALREAASRFVSSYRMWARVRNKVLNESHTAAFYEADIRTMLRRAQACSLCLTSRASRRNQSDINGLLRAAALVQSEAELTRLISHDTFLRCSAFQPSSRTRAVWPLYALSLEQCGMFNPALGGRDHDVKATAVRLLEVSYLAPILQARQLFGRSHVDVFWVEQFYADPAATLERVVHGAFGLPLLAKDGAPLARFPTNRSEIDASLHLSADVATNYVGSWWWRDADSTGIPITPAAIKAVRTFFEPFERSRREVFAEEGLPQPPPERLRQMGGGVSEQR